MVIVYESKTGFTRRYADMLADKTGFKVFSTKQSSKIDHEEEIIFDGVKEENLIPVLEWLRSEIVEGYL